MSENATMEEAAVECALCGADLTPEEVESPDHDSDGEVICSNCWFDENMDYCARCGSGVPQAELLADPGSLIGVWCDAPGNHETVEPGYYQVKVWPFYSDGIIEGHLFNDALEWVGPLDSAAEYASREAPSLAGPVCAECREKLTAHFAATPTAPQGAEGEGS